MKIYRRIVAAKGKKSDRPDGMLDSVDDLVEFLTSLTYVDFTHLMSPLEVYVLRQGSCHDQTMFAIQELLSYGITPKAKFLMVVDESGQGGETHSFAYYKKGNTWYWIEGAWDGEQGIHTYSNESALINDVVSKFRHRNPEGKLYVADFDPTHHTIGEDLTALVDKCMLIAEEWN